MKLHAVVTALTLDRPSALPSFGLPSIHDAGPMRAQPVMVYVLGDVHLGEGGAALIPFLLHLAQQPPARLLILGDLVDYWLDDRSSVQRFQIAFTALRALRTAGWRLDLICGNRELMAGRRLACATGAALHWPRCDIATPNGVIRVVHGDRLCRDPGYHCFAAIVRGFWLRCLQQIVPAAMAHGIAAVVRGRSRAKGRGRVNGAPLRYLDPRRVRAAGRGCRSLVAGHIHAALRARVAGVDLTLCGDWPDDHGRWVQIDSEGTITRHHQRWPAVHA